MLNCDRCKLYAAGQSSICENQSYKKIMREDYESLDETFRMEKNYIIESGYGSCYDNFSIVLTGEILTEKELRDRHPWITDIGYDANHLCDDCIKNMIINKEAVAGINSQLIAPFYTSCCNKLFSNPSSHKDFYDVQEVSTFPYISYFKIINWYARLTNNNIPSIYIKREDAFFSFSYSSLCIICKDCFNKNSDYTFVNSDSDQINGDNGMINLTTKNYFPYRYTLADLRSKCEKYIDFPHRGKELSLTSHNSYDPHEIRRYRYTYYYYKSKKNNLLLKKELSLFIAKRNLYLLRKYFPISNDIISCILKYF